MAKSTPASYDPAEEPAAAKPAAAKTAATKSVAEPAAVTPPLAAHTAHHSYPGQTLGIVALVFAVFMQVPALAMGIIAWVWSHKAGVRNVPAIIAVSVSGALIIIGTALFAAWIALVGSFFGGGYGGHQPPAMYGGPVQIMPGEDMMGDGDFRQQMKDMLKDMQEGNLENMPAPGQGMMTN